MTTFIGAVPGEPPRTGEDCLLERVIDDGRGMMPRSDSPGPGLGLTMMASMTSRRDIRDGPSGRGTEVRMVIAAPGVTGH